MSHEKAPHPNLSPESIANGVSYTDREKVIGEFNNALNDDWKEDIAWDINEIESSPRKALPVDQRVNVKDLKSREQVEEDLKVTPGFLRTETHHVYRIAALREKNKELAEKSKEADKLKEQWIHLGGKAIEEAQRAVDELNFRSTAEDHVRAKYALRDAKDTFAENLRAEQAAALAEAAKANAPAAPEAEKAPTPTDGDKEPEEEAPAAGSKEDKKSDKSEPAKKTDSEPATPKTPDASGVDSPDKEASKERLEEKEYRVGEYALIHAVKNGKEGFIHSQVAARSTDGKFVYVMNHRGERLLFTTGELNEARKMFENANKERERKGEDRFEEVFMNPDTLEKIQEKVSKVKFLTPISENDASMLEWEIINQNPGDEFMANASDEQKLKVRKGIVSLWSELSGNFKKVKDLEKEKEASVKQGIKAIENAGGLPRRPTGGESQAAATPNNRTPVSVSSWSLRKAKFMTGEMKEKALKKAGGTSERTRRPSGLKTRLARAMQLHRLSSRQEHPATPKSNVQRDIRQAAKLGGRR